MNERQKILEEAIQCVCSDRNEQYGSPEDNFAVIAEFWDSYLLYKKREEIAMGEFNITPKDVAEMMVLFKIGRACTASVSKKDTYVDIAGYAACAGGLCNED